MPGIDDIISELPEWVVSGTSYDTSHQQVDGLRLMANESFVENNSLADVLYQSYNEYPRSPKHLESLLYPSAPEMCTAMVGATECIDVLIRSICVQEYHSVGVVVPTFSMYKLRADLNGYTVNEYQSSDLPYEIYAGDQLLFLCDPNNPLPYTYDLEKLLDGDRVIAVDRAYYEFSDNPGPLLDPMKYPNLVYIYSFSKAYGLPGIRVGYTISHPALAIIFKKLRLPWGISEPSLLLAEEAVKENHSRVVVSETLEMRDKWEAQIEEKLPFLRFVSHAGNFMVYDTKPRSALSIARFLESKGILIRTLGSHGLPLSDLIRITVGSDADLEKFMETAVLLVDLLG